jgi:hypothetical protein
MTFDGEHTRRVIELFAGIFADTLKDAAALAVTVDRLVMNQCARKLWRQRCALGLLAHLGFGGRRLQQVELMC